MKKVINLSLVLLWAFIGLLVVAPNVFAEGEVDTLHLVVYSQEGDPLYNQQIAATLGSKTSISFDGIDVSGKEFAFLIHNGKKIDDINTEFIFSASTYVVAVYKDENQNVAAFVDTNGKLLDIKYSDEGEFKPSSSVASTKPGYRWVGWDLESDTVVDVDMVVKPIYELLNANKINVIVTDGHGLGDYEYNELVTITSDLPGFTHWEDENGVVVSYSNEYTFSAIKDRELVAKTDGTEEPLIYLQDVSGIREGYESYLGQVYLPVGYELVQTGLLVSGSVIGNQLDYNGPSRGDFVSKSVHPTTNEFLYSIPNEQEDNIRAYAIVKDIEDNLHYVHSSYTKNTLSLHMTLDLTRYNDLPYIVYFGGTFFNDEDWVNIQAYKWDYEKKFTGVIDYVWYGLESDLRTDFSYKWWYKADWNHDGVWAPGENIPFSLNTSDRINYISNSDG